MDEQSRRLSTSSSSNHEHINGAQATWESHSTETMENVAQNDRHDDEVDEISASLTREMEGLQQDPTFSDDCCIYRVPERLRSLDEEAFTPRIVSIGPFHHGKEKLKPMEGHKRRYLQEFVLLSQLALTELVGFFKVREVRLRNSYSEPIELSSNSFVKMMLLDATFVVMVLLKPNFPHLYRRFGVDGLLMKYAWVLYDIKQDMLLLENQLPFFIVDELVMLSGVTRACVRIRTSTTLGLIQQFIRGVADPVSLRDCLNTHDFSKVRHIVDFLQICQQPLELKPKVQLDNLSAPSIEELHRAGVRFQESNATSNKSLLEMKFENGVLEIPRLKITDESKAFFRNLQAFEQCHCYYSNRYVNEYIQMLSLLVRSPKDVEILVKNKILENILWNDEAVSAIIHDLDRRNLVDLNNFYFADIIHKLNEHCAVPWNKTVANLKQDYFNTPWAGLSVFAACILLLLTLLQTVFSILQVVH